MIPVLTALKSAVRLRRMRGRFPRSVIYAGAAVSPDSRLGDFAVLFSGASLEGSAVGAHSYIQSGSALTNADVGPFCSIAGGVIIGLAAHPTTMVSTSPVFYDCEQPLPRFFTRTRLFTANLPRTTVGADVWIGQGAMVKAGVSIGVGAVIGAGAVVTRDIPPYAIVAGVPARLARMRFPEEICHRLLHSRWWESDTAELERLAPLFSDPELFLAAVERLR